MSLNMTARFSFKYIFFCFALSFSAQGAILEDSKSFVNELGRKAIETLTDGAASPEQVRADFRKLLEEGFDVPKISEFVLGRIGRQATPDQKKRFLDLFKTRLEHSYAARFKDYKGVSFTVENGRVESDGGAVINSVIQKPGGPASSIDWKIYKNKENQLKIYDVTVEGVSMSQTLRSDYSSAFIGTGSNMDKFLESLVTN